MQETLAAVKRGSFSKHYRRGKDSGEIVSLVDPRYFRKGPPAGLLVRVADSLKQIVVARQDSGAKTFNASNILGVAAGIGFSNLYYPSASRTGTVMLSRVVTSLAADGMGNLMSEFWPDVRRKFFRKKKRGSAHGPIIIG